MKKLMLIPLFLFSFIFASCTTDDEDDAIITCNTYDDWLFACDDYCTMSVACEDNYLSLTVGDKILLDDCADLYLYDASLEPPICSPGDTGWTNDLAACIGYGEDLLGMVCDYPSECGDGYCDADENYGNCAQDCDPVCGDGYCEGDEDAVNCADDCGGSYCGDDVCDADEDIDNCAEDCLVCGDGYCEGDEDAWTCIDDCGADAALEVCDNYAIWVEDYYCEDTGTSWDCTLPSTTPLCEEVIYDEFDFAATAQDVDDLQICAEELSLTNDTCIDYEYATDLWCSDLLITIVGVECTEEVKKKK
ncbi:MAG: hypothetical protein PF689_06405 [Deltaproteobacteria bacterium]|jgi:hypothetical protein|nr:hypothetical protein [Deltaproteobacteria bacterium]